jgi:hypothetical protein
MEYKFVIRASAFHKGSIRVMYDPTGLADNAAMSAADPSLVKTTVVSVNGVTETIFETPWSLPSLFVRTKEFAQAGVGGNGRLFVLVDTPLTCNGVAAPVRIDVFVRGARDFRWGPPTTKLINTYAPILYAQALSTQVSKPHLVTYGEKVDTITALCRRFSVGMLWDFSWTPEGTMGRPGLLTDTLPAFLPLRQWNLSNVQMVLNNTYCSWFEAAFNCQRGGTRVALSRGYEARDYTSQFGADILQVLVGGGNSIVRLGNLADWDGVSTNPKPSAWVFRDLLSTGVTPMGDAGIYEIYPSHHGFFRVANAGVTAGNYPPNSTTGSGSTFSVGTLLERSDPVFSLMTVAFAGADDYTLSSFDMCPAVVSVSPLV